ncbi:MAG TPA: type II toxin-antitoxin system VapC family toxin [Blastocatellia bacterium]|nr:type II toxin-antitoxin system VapC family toxin [Blastocatellia bacterium]
MPSLYLETSVIGAYLDRGESFRRDLTIRWWDHELQHYRAFVSPLVERELERTREPYRRSYLNLIEKLPRLEVQDEAAILADGYIARGIFQRKYLGDALHVALASVHKIDYIVTWNFGYLASVHRQARIKLFNTAAGFFVPEIVTPEFLVSEL